MAFNGGGGRAAFFRTAANHSAIYSGLTGTTAATAATGAAMVLGGTVGDDIVVQTAFTVTDKGELNIKWTTTAFNQDVDNFLKAVIPRTSSAASVTTNVLVDETGRSIGGSASNGVPILVLPYGAVQSGGTDRLLHAAIGSFKITSGGMTFKTGDWVQLDLEFLSVPCKATSGLTIAKALFEGDLVDTATIDDQVLGLSYYYDRFFLAQAA